VKKILGLVVVMSWTLLLGCGKKEFTGVSEDYRYTEMYRMSTFSPTGVFFRGSSEMVFFRPEDAKEAVLLCYDPNCIHEPASQYNPDPTCRAALFPDVKTYIAYYEGYIYYFVNEDLFSHKIYKMEVDGAGRVPVAEIPYTAEIPGGMVFCEDKMYYIVAERTSVGEMGELESKNYVLEYDLKSDKYRIVTSQITDGPLGDAMQVTKDYLYLNVTSSSENGAIYVKRYNLKTTEEEVFISTKEYQTHRPIRVYDDYYVYYDTSGKIGIRDLDTGKDTIIVEQDGEGWLNPVASGNGLFYRIYESKEDGSTELSEAYFYNILTGEEWDITDKVTEFDIKGYDAYNKVFICGSFTDTCVVSEAKVLGVKGDVSE